VFIARLLSPGGKAAEFKTERNLIYTIITDDHKFFFGKSLRFICENLCDLRENDL
jgi:hypothetical protein